MHLSLFCILPLFHPRVHLYPRGHTRRHFHCHCTPFSHCLDQPPEERSIKSLTSASSHSEPGCRTRDPAEPRLQRPAPRYKGPGGSPILSDALIHPCSDGSSSISMVVFVDLDQDAFQHPGSALPLEKPFPPKLRVAPVATSEPAEFPPSPTSSDGGQDTNLDVHTANLIPGQNPAPQNPNRNAFSAALSCYPYVDLPKSSPRLPSPHKSQGLIIRRFAPPLELSRKSPALSI